MASSRAILILLAALCYLVVAVYCSGDRSRFRFTPAGGLAFSPAIKKNADDISCQRLDQIEWWKKTNFYHIYIRSFRDSDGDGAGDLRGVIERLNYLQMIDAGTLLLSPFYKSPQKDAGYDISDYKAVDERYGTLADFEELTREAHKRGLKIVVDFVPNHSSNEHPWFECSERALIEPDRCGKYRDYYVWSSSRRFEGKYPTNWVPIFGNGSSWEWSEIRQQFYLHQFLPEQPDLNFDHEPVRREFDEIVRFWARKGVDGFRIDAFSFIYEDLDFTDDPPNPDYDPEKNIGHERLLHKYTMAQPRGRKQLRDWQLILQEPEFAGQEKILITEAYDELDVVLDYYGPSPDKVYAQMPFNFKLLEFKANNWNATALRDKLQDWVVAVQGKNWPRQHGAISPWTIWVTGNHDQTRMVTRLGEHFAHLYKWVSYFAPGVAVTYNGDELGLPDLDGEKIPERTLAEGESTRLAYRSPMPWTKQGGFSANPDPWLPLNKDVAKLNVQSQLAVSSGKTHLKDFLRMRQITKDHRDLLVFGDLVFFKADSDDLFTLARTHPKFGNLLVVSNFNEDHPASLSQLMANVSTIEKRLLQPPTGTVRVLLTNFEKGEVRDGARLSAAKLELAPHQAAIIQYKTPANLVHRVLNKFCL